MVPYSVGLSKERRVWSKMSGKEQAAGGVKEGEGVALGSNGRTRRQVAGPESGLPPMLVQTVDAGAGAHCTVVAGLVVLAMLPCLISGGRKLQRRK